MQRPKDDNKTCSGPQGEPELGRPHGSNEGPAESVAGAPAIAGRTANDSPHGMGLSLTAHAQMTNLEGSRVLSCGVDTLDLGLHVEWGDDWDQQSTELEKGKAKASGTPGIPVNDGEFLILPGGKGQNFSWHLQWPEFHLFLSKSKKPKKNTPNVYASISSKTLWQTSIESAVALVVRTIERFGGRVTRVKPSRCDLAADFFLPNDLSLEFLLALRFPHDGKHSHNMTDGRLETFYQGAKRSPVQMRLYNKSLEVLKGGTKLWFLDIWKLQRCEHVWRVEFQLRRPFLKARGIDSVPVLIESLAGLWSSLTESWFSLRLPDDSNASRRTIHPWWLQVQCCDVRFGERRPLGTKADEIPADAEWYVSHCGGCLAAYAARRRFPTFDEASRSLVREMRTYWAKRNFDEQYTIKSIQLGFTGNVANPSNDQPNGLEAA